MIVFCRRGHTTNTIMPDGRANDKSVEVEGHRPIFDRNVFTRTPARSRRFRRHAAGEKQTCRAERFRFRVRFRGRSDVVSDVSENAENGWSTTEKRRPALMRGSVSIRRVILNLSRFPNGPKNNSSCSSVAPKTKFPVRPTTLYAYTRYKLSLLCGSARRKRRSNSSRT